METVGSPISQVSSLSSVTPVSHIPAVSDERVVKKHRLYSNNFLTRFKISLCVLCALCVSKHRLYRQPGFPLVKKISQRCFAHSAFQDYYYFFAFQVFSLSSFSVVKNIAVIAITLFPKIQAESFSSAASAPSAFQNIAFIATVS